MVSSERSFKQQVKGYSMRLSDKTGIVLGVIRRCGSLYALSDSEVRLKIIHISTDF